MGWAERGMIRGGFGEQQEGGEERKMRERERMLYHTNKKVLESHVFGVGFKEEPTSQ